MVPVYASCCWIIHVEFDLSFLSRLYGLYAGTIHDYSMTAVSKINRFGK